MNISRHIQNSGKESQYLDKSLKQTGKLWGRKRLTKSPTGLPSFYSQEESQSVKFSHLLARLANKSPGVQTCQGKSGTGSSRTNRDSNTAWKGR